MKIKLSNEVYDALMWVSSVVLPALVVLYTTLGTLWGWPKTTEVAGTLAGVDVFLGALLKTSNAQYKADLEEFPEH